VVLEVAAVVLAAAARPGDGDEQIRQDLVALDEHTRLRPPCLSAQVHESH